MITRKNIGRLAMLTPLWFLTVYVVMSALRPEYSHLHKAISELGSLDAPHLWYWNVLGYVIPGLAIAWLGIGIKREFVAAGWFAQVPSLALVASGLLMTLSGVFPADFGDRNAPTMIVHAVGAIGSFVMFLVAGLWLPGTFSERANWRWLVWPSLTLVIASFVSGFLRVGDMPGLGQRLGFACVFLWVGLVGYALVRANTGSKRI